jgi:hypothetical protein
MDHAITESLDTVLLLLTNNGLGLDSDHVPELDNIVLKSSGC